jgi:putative transposase
VTAPRQVLPGTTYLVTRRTSERRFFVPPCAHTNATFLYVLAIAARLHRIEIHAFCVLSNHFHLLLTDPAGRLPAFKRRHTRRTAQGRGPIHDEIVVSSSTQG